MTGSEKVTAMILVLKLIAKPRRVGPTVSLITLVACRADIMGTFKFPKISGIAFGPMAR